MNPITKLAMRADIALKAATMRFAGRMSSWSRVLLPNSKFDYAREVGDGYTSSLIVSALMWVGKNFPEAPIRVQQREADGTLTPRADHPMTLLIDEPNDAYDGELLMMATAIDLWASSNAYWRKIRSGAGSVVQLWWIPSMLIAPKWSNDGSDYVSHYSYKPDASMREGIRLEPDDIVHFRFGLNPHNTRVGVPTLNTLLREVFTDNEAANYTAALLKNVGVPGVIISPDTDNAIPADAAKEVKETFRASFGNDNRGDVMVMHGRSKIDVLSFNPQQMDLKALRRIPEERVAAVMGIPAIVLGFGAGLDRSTFANYAEAREAAYENAIIPVQRLVARAIKRQLLRDFESDRARYIVDFDHTNVRVLQEDENARVDRLNRMLASGAMLVSEWRSAVGLSSDASHEIYLRPLSILEVQAGATGRTGSLTIVDTTAKALAPGATKAAPTQAQLRHVQRLEREARSLETVFEGQLAGAFARIGRDVAANVRARQKALVLANGHKADDDTPVAYPDWITDIETAPGSVIPPDLNRTYVQAPFETLAQLAGEAAYGAASDTLGVGVDWNLSNDDAIRLLQQGGTHAAALDLTAQTRNAIMQAIADGAAEGDSIRDLIARIEDYTTGAHMYPGIAEAAEAAGKDGAAAAAKYRAQVIARTEVSTMMNAASIAAYERSGVVSGALCLDGDDCGLTSHDDPDLCNLSVRSLATARAYPLAHPQCVRAWAPVIEGVA